MRKLIVFLLLAYPIYRVVFGLLTNSLSADPIDYILDTSGEWTLGMLVLTLSCTPLRKLFKDPEFSKFKRMFGLYTFFYATIHLLTYIGLDQSFNWSEIYNQIITKKFILIGLLAWILLIPLALTSNNFSIKLLKKDWKVLHKLTYVVGILAILHYVWLVKTIIYEPLIYMVIMFVLLLSRKFTFKDFWYKFGGLIKFLLIISPILYILSQGTKTPDNNTSIGKAIWNAKLEKNNDYYTCYEHETKQGTNYEIKINKCNKLWKD